MPAWLHGDGTMAACIRAHDWAATPLGPVETWPQTLRTAVSLMLGAAQPVYIAWGPELTSLYNDGYLPIVGTKHPGIGLPFAELWAEIWDEFRPIVEKTMAGDAQHFIDLPIALAGRPSLPVGYFTFSYTALPGDDGKIAGFYCAATETTDKVMAEAALRESEERQAFLLKLSDAVRPLAGPADIQGETTRLLREQLNAGWCYYVDWNLDGKSGLALRDSAREGLPSLVGAHDVSDAPQFLELLASGTMLTVPDYASYEQLPGSTRRKFAALGFRSMMAAPLFKEGRLIASLLVGDTEIRDWSASEASLLVDVAERTWVAIERGRAEEAMRESEERQAILLKLSDAFRAEHDTNAVATLALRTLADRLQLDRCYIAEYRLEEDRADFTHQVGNDRVPPLPGGIRLSDFPNALQIAIGRTLVIDDVEHAEFLSEIDKRNMQAFSMGALVAPAARKGENVPLFAIVAVSASARHWTPGEIVLIEEVNERTWAAVERARTEAALRESEEQFRRSVVEAPIPVMMHAEDGEVLQVSRSWTELTGYTLEDASIIQSWLTKAYGVGGEDVREAMELAFGALDGDAPMRAVNFEIVTRFGEKRHWSFSASSPGTLKDGRRFIVGMAEDITERARAEAGLLEGQKRQEVLVAELQHRTRNLITVVGALSQRTAAESGSLEDFGDRFRHRLAALSRVQGLLSQLSAGARISFGDLLNSELAALGAPAEQLTLEGPEDVALRSATVQTFALALHELATNAVKHGAFAAPGGRLTVRWTTAAGADGSRRLQVDWRESGVDMAAHGDHVASAGYGRELIEQALPYQLGAETSYELTDEGVHCTIIVPLDPVPAPAE
ncbi:MAG TPA: GAF domain-containing protein [Qipengyuania sp.]|nr:GAF domain-containing protein [Qipengyuania sp.]